MNNSSESFTDDASMTAKELIQDPLSQSSNRLAYLSPTLTERMRLSGTPSLSINGLVIVSSDHEYTKRPEPGTTINVYPEESNITLPLTAELPTEENNEGGELPDTATSKPLFILIGASIAIAGIILLFIGRNNKSRMQQ